MSVTVPLAYPAAIPAGHRVELTWFTKLGGMRGNKPTARPFEPYLRDLDSGIAYGAEWQLGEFVAFRSGTVNAYQREPLAGLEVASRLRGRVVGCTIVHVGMAEPYQQTLLVLDEE